MTAVYQHLQAVTSAELPDYPFELTDRLDSHFFMAWERRRWLNSDMRIKGTPECRALYFDLINVAFDHSPVGTLPDDLDMLSKFALCEQSHFKALCGLPFGPLHKWGRVNCEGEVRLAHPFVIKVITEAISRKHDNQAKNEAANNSKRLQRLRGTIAGYHADLAKNDAAVLWMDGWLVKEGCEYRSAAWIERGMDAWTNHAFSLGNVARVRT